MEGGSTVRGSALSLSLVLVTMVTAYDFEKEANIHVSFAKLKIYI